VVDVVRSAPPDRDSRRDDEPPDAGPVRVPLLARAAFAGFRVLRSPPTPTDAGEVLRRLRVARVAGLLGLVSMVACGGKLAAPIGQVAPTTWFGLLGSFETRAARGAAGVGLIGGLVLAAWAFLAVLRLSQAGRVPLRSTLGTAALWSVPVLLGPPLMSLDVHSYVAQGEMVRLGLDPYRVGPEFIRGDFYDPVDPRWRAAHAPYGPLALLLSRLAVSASGQSPVGSVLLLRLVAVLAVVLAAVLALRLSVDRPTTFLLAAGAPLVLVTLVSAAHHEALVTVLVVGALLAEQARHPALAVGLAAAALADKLPGAVALGALGVLHLLHAAGGVARLRVLARDGLAVAAVWVPLALLVPDPLGWVKALSTPGLGHAAYAPVSLVAFVTRVPESLVRAAGEVLSVVIVGRLILTVRRRPLPATVGWGLFAVALLGPVLYPWYLTPAVVVLATQQGRGAQWVSAASGSWGLVLLLPPVERALRWAGRPTAVPAHGVVASGPVAPPPQLR